MPLTNTLENARRFQTLGFTEPQAQGFAEILEDTLSVLRADLVTKDFLRQEMSDLRAELRAEIAELRSEFRTGVKDLELRVAERLRGQMVWFFATQVALIIATVAAFKLLP